MKSRRKRILILGVVIATTLAMAFQFYVHSRNNSPEQNKKIELQAFKEKNPAFCKRIRGNSYYFGGADQKIATSQSQAQEQCRQNIKNGTEPYLTEI